MKTIVAGTRGCIRIDAEATVQCPFDDVTDEYDVIVEYRPDSRAVELQSFADYLTKQSDREVSQERFTESLFQRLKAVLRPVDLTVTVRGEHYGVTETVVRSL